MFERNPIDIPSYELPNLNDSYDSDDDIPSGPPELVRQDAFYILRNDSDDSDDSDA